MSTKNESFQILILLKLFTVERFPSTLFSSLQKDVRKRNGKLFLETSQKHIKTTEDKMINDLIESSAVEKFVDICCRYVR